MDKQHGPDDCTYRCPNTGHEVLAFRDERHVVVPSDENRALLADDASTGLDLEGIRRRWHETQGRVGSEYLLALLSEVERLRDALVAAHQHLPYGDPPEAARIVDDALRADPWDAEPDPQEESPRRAVVRRLIIDWLVENRCYADQHGCYRVQPEPPSKLVYELLNLLEDAGYAVVDENWSSLGDMFDEVFSGRFEAGSDR